MFGAAIRTAAGWAGGMLVISVLSEIINPVVLPRLAKGELLYRSLEGAVTFLPLLITVAAIMQLIARALAERRVV